MAHCHPSNRTYTGIAAMLVAPHFGSMPMHLVILTVPSKTSNFTISHAASDHEDASSYILVLKIILVLVFIQFWVNNLYFNFSFSFEIILVSISVLVSVLK